VLPVDAYDLEGKLANLLYNVEPAKQFQWQEHASTAQKVYSREAQSTLGPFDFSDFNDLVTPDMIKLVF
jgi:hypothetical protein